MRPLSCDGTGSCRRHIKTFSQDLRVLCQCAKEQKDFQANNRACFIAYSMACAPAEVMLLSVMLLWAAAASRMLMASVWLELYRLLPARLLSDLRPAQAALMVPGLPPSGRALPPCAACACGHKIKSCLPQAYASWSATQSLCVLL